MADALQFATRLTQADQTALDRCSEIMRTEGHNWPTRAAALRWALARAAGMDHAAK